MPFVSKPIKKCKHCDKPAKKNIVNGINKGYNRTCGSELCLNVRYVEAAINMRQGVMKKDIISICTVCNVSFKRTNCNNTMYCKTCVPSPKWQRVAKLYGIGKSGWDIIFRKQNGKCALCEREATCIDHDHETGKVRGMLCHGCNHIIIAIEKGDNWISKAKKYLENQQDAFSLNINTLKRVV